MSGRALMQAAAITSGVARVEVHGRSHFGDNTSVFNISDIESDRVFLCYQVNGETLPEKHGYPLRVVAEGHFGPDWTKYVYRVEFVGPDYRKPEPDPAAGA